MLTFEMVTRFHQPPTPPSPPPSSTIWPITLKKSYALLLSGQRGCWSRSTLVAHTGWCIEGRGDGGACISHGGRVVREMMRTTVMMWRKSECFIQRNRYSHKCRSSNGFNVNHHPTFPLLLPLSPFGTLQMCYDEFQREKNDLMKIEVVLMVEMKFFLF